MPQCVHRLTMQLATSHWSLPWTSLVRDFEIESPIVNPNPNSLEFASLPTLLGKHHFEIVNSGIIYVPDLHPTPFCFFWGFFLVYFWSVFRRPRWRRSLGFLLVAALHAFNACVTTYGGSEARHLTPPLG